VSADGKPPDGIFVRAVTFVRTLAARSSAVWTTTVEALMTPDLVDLCHENEPLD